MHLTTPRRGLAVSAVAALTLTGLGAAPALAEEVAAPEGGIALLTPFNAARAVTTRAASPFSDSKPVRLVAEVAESEATVGFSYNPDPQAADDAEGWVLIGESAVADGFASVSWSPAADLEGRQVALRAVASTTVGDLTTSVTDALGGVTVAPSGRNGTPANLDSVTLSGSDGGYFPQPYADSDRTASLLVVAGDVSGTTGTVAVSAWRSADGAFVGTTDAAVEADPMKNFGEFHAALDVSASGLDAGDTVAVGAERDTDDVATYVLTEQRIRSIEAYAEPVRAGETAQVVVGVGANTEGPVAGVEVRRLSDGTVVGYTDVDGYVTTTQVGGTPETYYANATDADGYAADEGDVTTEPFDPTYVPEPTSVDGYLGDGPVFDRDELAPGDVGVLVRDQQGEPLGGADVEYRLYPSAETPPETWESATTEEDGVAPVSPGSEDADGTYTLDYRLPAPEQDPEDPPVEPEFSSTEFTVGQAALTLDPGAETVRADSGGTVEYSGRLALGETGLPDRLIDLEYLRGLEFVPGRAADAGIETDEGLALTQSVTTDEDGRFTVRVTDPAEAGSPTESGGSLQVATGDTVATEGSTVTGNAGEEVSSGTEFGRGRGSATLRRGASGNGAGADVVKVRGPGSVAGETVRVFRVTAGGGRRVVATRTLDANGDARARVEDLNGTRFTTYVVKLVPSRRVTASEAPPIRVR